MTDWQPIETAPSAGEMLGWSEAHGMSLVYCDQFLRVQGGVAYYNGDTYCSVTHWMPLPEPPAPA